MKTGEKLMFVGLILSLALTTLTAQDLFEADIYLLGSNKEVLLFTHKNSEKEIDGKLVWTQYYYQPDGTLFAKDQLILDKNERWETHKTSFPPLNEYSVMKRDGDKVNIMFSRDGKEKTRTSNIKNPIVFGATQQRFLYENFNRIKGGEELILYTPAPEFLRLIKLNIRRIENSEYEKPGLMVVKMETKNPILSWFVGKSYYVIDLENRRIVEIHGSSILKRQVNGKWDYVDVDMYFTYPEK